MTRDFRSGPAERLFCLARYYRRALPDLVAGLASAGLLLVVVLIVTLF